MSGADTDADAGGESESGGGEDGAGETAEAPDGEETAADEAAADEGPPVLRLDGVGHAFGDLTVLEDVSLSVAAGEVAAVVGPNGAGKTTLLRATAGLLAADAGRVAVARRDGAARAVGYLPQAPAFRAGFTAGETVAFYRALVGEESDAAPLDRVGLGEVRDRRVGALSGGMTRLLGLATATVGDPPVLVLDEPTSSLDPKTTGRVFEAIRGLAREGVGVLLSSHDLGAVERNADRVVVLDAGRVVADEAPDALTERTGADGLAGAFDRVVETDEVQTGRRGAE